MKKILSIVMAALMVCMCSSLTACGKKYDYVIGINQFATFTALDLANEGFVEELNKWAKENGKTIDFKQNNAQGEVSNAGTIAANLSSLSSIDLIYSIATPSATATASKIKDKKIPMLYTAVTDPGVAQLTNLPNITGTSDMGDIDKQIDLALKTKENVQKVGLLQCSGEPNSDVQIEMAEKRLNDKGITDIVKASAAKTDEVKAVVEQLIAKKVDVIYIPTDNLMANNMGTIYNLCKDAKIPVVAGDGGMVQDGGFATLAIRYKELGAQTARMAIKILTGTKPADLPYEHYQGTSDLILMEERCADFGVTEAQLNIIKQEFGNK